MWNTLSNNHLNKNKITLNKKTHHFVLTLQETFENILTDWHFFQPLRAIALDKSAASRKEKLTSTLLSLPSILICHFKALISMYVIVAYFGSIKHFLSYFSLFCSRGIILSTKNSWHQIRWSFLSVLHPVAGLKPFDDSAL